MKNIEIILGVLCFLFSSNANSMIENMFGYKCNEENNTLEILQFVFEEETEYLQSEYGIDSSKYELINPASLLKYEQKNGKHINVGSTDDVRECELESGTYHIIFNGFAGGTYLHGRCGAYVSGTVTIRFGNFPALELNDIIVPALGLGGPGCQSEDALYFKSITVSDGRALVEHVSSINWEEPNKRLHTDGAKRRP